MSSPVNCSQQYINDTLGGTTSGGSTTTSGSTSTSTSTSGTTSGGDSSVSVCPLTDNGLTQNFDCKCTNNGSGSVWGTAHFTGDSNICAAARHAGIPIGQTIKIRFGGQCSVFTGTSKNGVSTSSFGPWNKTFYFEGVSSGTACAQMYLGESGGTSTSSSTSGGSTTGSSSSTSGSSTVGGGTTTNLCPTTDSGLSQNFDCICNNNGNAGAVWGSSQFTGDSNICAAAKHAGIALGQPVKVRISGACSAFVGSSRNGVNTMSYGSWGRTFYFEGVSSPTICAQQYPNDNGGGGSNSSSGFSTTGGDSVNSNIAECPATDSGLVQNFDCRCSNGSTGGSIWGTGHFTGDSNICAAAKHAGIPQGQTIKVRLGGRCEVFASTSRNGITTSGYGPWNRSFSFEGVSSQSSCSQQYL